MGNRGFSEHANSKPARFKVKTEIKKKENPKMCEKCGESEAVYALKMILMNQTVLAITGITVWL